MFKGNPVICIVIVHDITLRKPILIKKLAQLRFNRFHINDGKG